MLIIIDFDNTIFNTIRLKNDLAKALIEFGIKPAFFYKIYPKILTMDKNSYGFSLNKYINYLKRVAKINVDEKKARKHLNQIINRSKKYIFPDFFSFVQKIKKRHWKLILLSFGNGSFQKLKIKKSRLKKYFDRVYITDEGKKYIFRQILKDFNNEKNIFFINDQPKESEEVKKNTAKITVLIRKNPNLKYSKKIQKKYLIFNNLKEMSKIFQ